MQKLSFTRVHKVVLFFHEWKVWPHEPNNPMSEKKRHFKYEFHTIFCLRLSAISKTANIKTQICNLAFTILLFRYMYLHNTILK
jgi:hypothetical protein